MTRTLRRNISCDLWRNPIDDAPAYSGDAVHGFLNFSNFCIAEAETKAYAGRSEFARGNRGRDGEAQKMKHLLTSAVMIAALAEPEPP
jgi:hypothetical protein